MSADKRRMNRIQGGVNERGRGTRGIQRGRARSFGQRPIGMPYQNEASAPFEEFPGTVLGSSRLPGEHAKEHSPFVFKDTNQVIREELPIITEIEEGETILSEGPTGISRIKFYPSFLAESYSECLFITLLRSLNWEERYMDIKGEKKRMPRKMCWFGPMPYGFSGCVLKGTNEMPDEILSLLTQIKQKTGLEFNSVLANLYENEHDSVAWHSDDELLMGVENTIASISLGEVRHFELRKKPPPEDNGDFKYMQHYRFPLPNGSLLIMNGFMQQDWQHRLPKEYHSRKPRINLTFRTVFSRSKSTAKRTEDMKSNVQETEAASHSKRGHFSKSRFQPRTKTSQEMRMHSSQILNQSKATLEALEIRNMQKEEERRERDEQRKEAAFQQNMLLVKSQIAFYIAATAALERD